MERQPRGNPPTLGSQARAGLDLDVWCNACGHKVIIGPEEMTAFAERYGEETILVDFCRRLRCSKCGISDVDSVVSGYRAPSDRL
jgi:hypothetical protein